MSPSALWLTIEVVDYEPTVAYYRDTIGLPLVDGWDRDGSRGAVFAVGGTGRIEVEEVAAAPTPPRLALEYPTVAALEALSGRTGGLVERHGRGHHGMSVSDPDGREIYLWSEQ